MHSLLGLTVEEREEESGGVIDALPKSKFWVLRVQELFAAVVPRDALHKPCQQYSRILFAY